MKKYFPVLKSKSGEIKALINLSTEVKEGTCPIIEILPESEGIIKTHLLPAWQFRHNELALDFSYCIDDGYSIDQIKNLLGLFEGTNTKIGICVNFNSSTDFKNLIRDYISKNESKIYIRIENKFALPNIFNPLIKALSTELNVQYENFVLWFDLGAVTSDVHIYTNSIVNSVNNLIDIEKFNAIVMTGGSFPINLGAFEIDTITEIQRYEWTIWNLSRHDSKVDKYLKFGDYGIKNPFIDPEAQRYSATASVKYTTKHGFLIFRGSRSSSHMLGAGQYHVKCREAISHEEYDGETFSWADKEIYECSERDDHPGNAEKWVTIGQNRHMTKIFSLL